jgi:3',5'-cyclic AMP phosphodiesterase CpdA
MIFDAAKTMSPAPAFVLWTGDTISGKSTTNLEAEYDEFFKLAKRAGVPVFNAPGNHEMDKSDNTPDKAMKDAYLKFINPKNKPSVFTYGAFSYGNSRFIALDSENEPSSQKKATREITFAEAEAKSEAPGAITKEQIDLLDADLAAAKKNNLKHVFIFMHHPMVAYSSKDGLDADSVAKLQKIFARHHNVDYVVSGHEHLYYYPGDKKKPGNHKKLVPPPSRTDPSKALPVYIVSGGGGAPLKDVPAGSIFHYLVFNVDGATVTPKLVELGSCGPCAKPDSCDPCSKQKKCSVLKSKPLQ